MTAEGKVSEKLLEMNGKPSPVLPNDPAPCSSPWGHQRLFKHRGPEEVCACSLPCLGFLKGRSKSWLHLLSASPQLRAAWQQTADRGEGEKGHMDGGQQPAAHCHEDQGLSRSQTRPRTRSCLQEPGFYTLISRHREPSVHRGLSHNTALLSRRTLHRALCSVSSCDPDFC